MLRPGLGITVLPEFIQTEGAERVLDNLARAGAVAVSTSPYVMAPAEQGEGSREPPADAGAGGVRLLDRPLWGGRRALHVTTAPSFTPDSALYEGLRYRPAEPSPLTEREGHVVGDFVRSAKARGLEVYLQVQAAIPPGYRVQFGGPDPDDEPHLPDGRPVPGRVDRNGSLASPHILGYGKALLKDLARAYPEADGFRIDWPEYPPYAFDALFVDFSHHALSAAERLGYDPGRLRHDVTALRETLLGGLEDADLDACLGSDGGRERLLRLLIRHPGVLDLLRLKADLVMELLAAYRGALPAGRRLVPQVFPSPFSLASGFDPARAAGPADAVGVKLYTMHWPMILRFWADALAGANPGLSLRLLARALVRLLDTGGPVAASLDELRYPEPDEAHPAGAAAQRRKIRAAVQAAGDCPVFAIAHGYGPEADVARRARIAFEAADGRLWVNRYGYLSDAKLDALGRIVRAAGG